MDVFLIQMICVKLHLQCSSNCTSAGIFRASTIGILSRGRRTKSGALWIEHARMALSICELIFRFGIQCPNPCEGAGRKKSKNEEKMCVSSNIRSFEARRRLNWYGIKVFFQLLSGTRKGRKLANVGLRPRTLDGKSQPDIMGFSPSLNWTLSPSHDPPQLKTI